VLPPNPGGRCPSSGNTELRFVIVQQNIPQDLLKDFDHHAVAFPTRNKASIPAKPQARSASRAPFGVLPAAGGGKTLWPVR
jgi:hypothetical protein